MSISEYRRDLLKKDLWDRVEKEADRVAEDFSFILRKNRIIGFTAGFIVGALCGLLL